MSTRLGTFAENHALMVLLLVELAMLAGLGRRGTGRRSSGGEE
jgi:hypothetical protein